jgi:ATP phosphoribosyltransferase regulatory subunit
MTQSREAVLGHLPIRLPPSLALGLQLSEVVWDRWPLISGIVCWGSIHPSASPVCSGEISPSPLSPISPRITHPMNAPAALLRRPSYRIPGPSDTELEQFQVGAELLGWEGTGADIEVLSLLLRALGRAVSPLPRWCSAT